MISLSNYKRETIINFNEGENTASVYTHNKAMLRKLAQLARERPQDCRLGGAKITHEGQAAEYYIPKSWVKITPKRILSDEQQAAMAESARNRFHGRKAQGIPGVQAHEASGEGKDTTPQGGRRGKPM